MDKNGLISTKTIIELLTGNKKFDVDEKFDKEGLIKFIESVVETHSDEENTLLESLEKALEGNTVFKEDVENPLYLKIVDYFKGLKDANKENKKIEKREREERRKANEEKARLKLIEEQKKISEAELNARIELARKNREIEAHLLGLRDF